MKTRRTTLILWVLLFSNIAVAEHSESSRAEIKERLGKVFYWQIADELDLKPDVEKKLVSILEDFQKKREELLQKREELFKIYHKDFSKDSPAPMAEKFLKDYQDINKGLGASETEEFLMLKKVLTPQQLTRFLLVRDVFSRKVRESLRRIESQRAQANHE
jgi:hypothetical protein